MTTIRLTPSQKRKLREASQILVAWRGRKVTQGEAVAQLAEFALRHRVLWVQEAKEPEPPLSEDPLFDMRIVFDMGKTDSSKLDDLIYGRE